MGLCCRHGIHVSLDDPFIKTYRVSLGFIDDMKVFFDNGLSCSHVGHALDQNYIMLHVVVDVRVKSLSNILVKHLEIEGIVCWSIEAKFIDTLGGE